MCSVLALLGYDVCCASYSRYLSERDEAAFTPLFELLGLHKTQIRYGTLNDLVEQIINEGGNVRDLVRQRITGADDSLSASLRSCPRILLFDEADLILSKTFYGSTYDTVSPFCSKQTNDIMTRIWNNRDSIHLRDLKQSPEYSLLLQTFLPEVAPLIDQHLRMMIEDARCFNDPPYSVSTDGCRIEYPARNSMASDGITYGYRTAFASLHEAPHYPQMAKELPDVLGFIFPCGNYSYASIPCHKALHNGKPVFDCLMGVTGNCYSP